MKNLILAALVMSMTSIAGAAELESGLQPGDAPPPFNVRDITGPKAGKTLCYRCMYGARPVVSIFAREIDDNVANLIKEVDKQVGCQRRQKNGCVRCASHRRCRCRRSNSEKSCRDEQHQECSIDRL